VSRWIQAEKKPDLLEQSGCVGDMDFEDLSGKPGASTLSVILYC
jgi:hypothetical protein